MIDGMDVYLKPFEMQDIVKARWKELVKTIENTHHPVYWLSNIPEKRSNLMKISLLVDMQRSYTQSGYKIISAKYINGTETVETAFIPIEYAERLAFFMLPDKYHHEIRYSKAGRPKKYTLADARKALSMRNQDFTIREIAEFMGTSTSQIQRLLNQVQTKEQRAAKAKYLRDRKK